MQQTFPKYRQNLKMVRYDGHFYVQSYTTRVAKVVGDELHQLGYWSVTTQKHINYVANYFNLKLIKP